MIKLIFAAVVLDSRALTWLVASNARSREIDLNYISCRLFEKGFAEMMMMD